MMAIMLTLKIPVFFLELAGQAMSHLEEVETAMTTILQPMLFSISTEILMVMAMEQEVLYQFAHTALLLLQPDFLPTMQTATHQMHQNGKEDRSIWILMVMDSTMGFMLYAMQIAAMDTALQQAGQIAMIIIMMCIRELQK